MAEPTLEQLETALRAAHEAGDTAAAQQLAQAYRQRSQAATQAPAGAIAPPAPSQGVTQGALETQTQAAAGNEGRGPSNFGQAFIASQPSPPTAQQAQAALLEVPRTLGQGTLAYAAGMARSLPVVFQEDSAEALKVLHGTMEQLAYVPDTEEGRVLVENLGKATAPLAALWEQVGNPGGKGDPYLGEWIQSGFAAVTGTAGLRRAKRVPEPVARIQANGYRPAVGERQVGAAEGRNLAASLGGRDSTNSLILGHNQRITNRTVNQTLGLPDGTRLDTAGLAEATQAARQSIAQWTQGGGRRNADINRALVLRERAVQALADGDKKTAQAQLALARRVEARVWADIKHRTGPRGPERADMYRAATDRLDLLDTIRPLVNESGDIDAHALRDALRNVPERLRQNQLGEVIYAVDNFPSSTKLATGVAQPSSGLSMFDIMLAPAVAATATSALGMGLGPTSAVAGGIGILMSARRLGRKYGAQAINQLESRLKPNVREARRGAIGGAMDEGAPDDADNAGQ